MDNDIIMQVKTKPTYKWPILDGGTVHLTKEGVFLLHRIARLAVQGAGNPDDLVVARAFMDKAHTLYVTAAHNT